MRLPRWDDYIGGYVVIALIIMVLGGIVTIIGIEFRLMVESGQLDMSFMFPDNDILGLTAERRIAIMVPSLIGSAISFYGVGLALITRKAR